MITKGNKNMTRKIWNSIYLKQLDSEIYAMHIIIMHAKNEILRLLNCYSGTRQVLVSGQAGYTCMDEEILGNADRRVQNNNGPGGGERK